MKIFIVCSTNFYDSVDNIKKQLINKGFDVVLPNGYEEEEISDEFMTPDEYYSFYKKMYYESRDKISRIDAILVLNFNKEKDGIVYNNYIGASTFLEMYQAFMQNKKIYMYNGYPDNMLYDEIKGFNPIIINGDLDKIN